LVVTVAIVSCLEFGVVIDPYETQCFYEQLGINLYLNTAAQAKYNV
jgi:hypothetical protein